MPRELDRCVEELKKKGYTESEAWRICRSSLGANYCPCQSIKTKEKVEETTPNNEG